MRKLSLAQLSRLMLHAAEVLHQNKDALSLLDVKVSGGNHGEVMDQVGRIMYSCCRDQFGASNFQQFFSVLSEAVSSYANGFSGLLWGGFFEGMSDYAPLCDEIDAECLRKMLMGGLDSLRVITEADVGDGTAMDAMIPAVQAAQSAPDDVLVMLRNAAAAAGRGADGTSGVSGRERDADQAASPLPLGQDPGATSAALIWRAWYAAAEKIAREAEKTKLAVSAP